MSSKHLVNLIKMNVHLTLYVAVIISSAAPCLLPNTGLSPDYVNNCAPTVECNADAKYRTINGTCNNLKIPWLGAAITPHLRLLDANYADGVYEFRRQTDGSPLPNARQIQIDLFLDRQSTAQNKQNVLFMEMGQFFAHDTTRLPPNMSDGRNCCDLLNRIPVPEQCRTVIRVPENDPVYTKYGQKCIRFNRAVTSAAAGCPTIPTNFMVDTTSFLDGSQIYGTNDKEAMDLRAREGGRLRSVIKNGKDEFCPQRKRGNSLNCESSNTSAVCYETGDPRVNQNLAIALFQNIFLKFHNVIVRKLQYINKHWDDETLYHEGRHIVICVLQHLTYTDYVSTLLGPDFYDAFIKEAVYDDSVNPSTSIEFASGALRVLHTEIPSMLNLWHNQQVVLTDWMDKPDLLQRDDNFDGFVYGFLNQPARAEQPSYNPLISNFMFHQTRPKFNGEDLLAIDIQRARDVGLRSYQDIRNLCGMELLKSFDDLVGIIEIKDIEILKTLYASVEDVDFLVGALLEQTLDGGMVGPTARCILADSFYRYKVGDSHFYDRLGQPWSLTPEQLEVVKNISLATVLCATSGIKRFPENVFVTPDSSTVLYECDHFPLNLDAWKEPTSS